MALLLGIHVAAGLLLSALSVPLIQRKVGPNPLYGFRVRRALEDPAVWYPANAYAAKGLLCVGLLTCTAAVVLYFVPGMDPGLYGMLMATVVLGGLAVNLVLSFRFLGKIAGRKGTAGQPGEDA
jgi:SdpI/YfhL protein family